MRTVGIETDLAKNCAEEKISLITPTIANMGATSPAFASAAPRPRVSIRPGTSTRYGSNSMRLRLTMEMVIFR